MIQIISDISTEAKRTQLIRFSSYIHTVFFENTRKGKQIYCNNRKVVDKERQEDKEKGASSLTLWQREIFVQKVMDVQQTRPETDYMHDH